MKITYTYKEKRNQLEIGLYTGIIFKGQKLKNICEKLKQIKDEDDETPYIIQQIAMEIIYK